MIQKRLHLEPKTDTVAHQGGEQIVLLESQPVEKKQDNSGGSGVVACLAFQELDLVLC